jgi:integrase
MNKFISAMAADPREVKPDAAQPTVANWAETYLDTYKPDLQPNTREDYARYLARVTAHMGGVQMGAVTLDMCQKFVNLRKDCGGESYIKKHAMMIKGLFTQAERNRLIAFNPAKGLKLPKGARGTHAFIGQDTQSIILRTWRGHRCGPLAALMLLAGLRRGEALALDPSHDINLSSLTITVNKALRFERGGPVIAPPKTAAGTRLIPIFPELLPVCQYLVDRGATAPLTKLNGESITKSAFRKAWAGYQKSLNSDGADQLPTCHDLRHTFCTLLFQAGVKLKTIQLWLGHADVSTSLNIYTHVTDMQQREDVNAMRGYLVSLGIAPAQAGG